MARYLVKYFNYIITAKPRGPLFSSFCTSNCDSHSLNANFCYGAESSLQLSGGIKFPRYIWNCSRPYKRCRIVSCKFWIEYDWIWGVYRNVCNPSFVRMLRVASAVAL